MTYYDILFSFFIYGFLGWCSEVAFAAFKQHSFVNRGFLNGPICPIYGIGVTVVVASLQPYVGNLILLYITSTILVTFLEWLTGFLLEKMFHHRWWDYSEMPLNIGGYVCPLFSAIWGVACVLIVKLIYPFTDNLVSFFPIWLGKFLLVLLSIALIVDICITVQGILKFNKRLALMEDIAKELRNISDQIGENIYDSMMDGLEAQDRLKARADVIREKVDEAKQENADELKARMDSLKQRAEELRSKYEKMAKLPTFTSRRILRAFPKMMPREHVREFGQLRRILKKKRDELKKS